MCRTMLRLMTCTLLSFRRKLFQSMWHYVYTRTESTLQRALSRRTKKAFGSSTLSWSYSRMCKITFELVLQYMKFLICIVNAVHDNVIEELTNQHELEPACLAVLVSSAE